MLAALVEDILDLTRLEAGQFSLNVSRFRLAEVVTELHDLFTDQVAAKGLQLIMDVD